MMGPPQLALSVEMFVAFLCAGAPPQLALHVEMLGAFLCAGAPIVLCWRFVGVSVFCVECDGCNDE